MCSYDLTTPASCHEASSIFGRKVYQIVCLLLPDAVEELVRAEQELAVVGDGAGVDAGFVFLELVVGQEFKLRLGRDHESAAVRSEEHTSELPSRRNLVCRLLLAHKNHY